VTADVPDVRPAPARLAPSGLAPSGLAPSGLAPSGLAPSGLAPSGLAPSRLALPSYGRPRGVHPPLDYSGYRSTALRHPTKPLVLLPQRLTEVTGPLLGDELITPADGDLTMQHAGEPQG